MNSQMEQFFKVMLALVMTVILISTLTGYLKEKTLLATPGFPRRYHISLAALLISLSSNEIGQAGSDKSLTATLPVK